MITQVSNIQQGNNADSLTVTMSIGDKDRQFTFTRKYDRIGDRTLQIITYDSDFGETFKFNQQIVAEVMKLVRQFYAGNRVKLPQDVGDFGTQEQALALQKPFYSKTEKTLLLRGCDRS